ncbi:ORF6N domain-containing protein [Niameybacter massiliensis]|uniref:ORF6N domain-containing protein n=1 Tax=Holtiella tumoricola TaxID=3018743 RepID=A0AA42J1A4_9FIRM|nr:ORF6N domain-containing protein [Holtiella tumoricola]MDA3732347.1 ORF6N domain-containing protein [Holtiella tumoricola]
MPRNALCKKEELNMPVLFKGEVVITTEMLASVYETDTNNIQANFARNKDKFEEGKHYILLQGAELKEFKSQPTNSQVVKKNTSQLYLWTERGASRHCKILDTDKAWEQFDYLEETYFKVKEQGLDIHKTLAEFRGQIIGLVDEQIGNAIKQVERKCSEYYKPSCADKSSISHYIKKRLGIAKADEEYELVKERVLIRLGARKWEDIDIETLRNSMDIIDESIRILKMERPYEQTSLFEKKGA